MIIPRTPEISIIKKRLRHYPIVAILGPRQCGKTVLSRQFSAQYKSDVTLFDLENPLDLRQLGEPLLTLGELKGLVIIDEVQRVPEIFPVLRVLADRPAKVKFLLLGSASRDLINRSSESLAGRISYIEIGGFSLSHINNKNMNRLWIRGGFPRSYLAAGEEISYQWRHDFIATFMERDIPQLGIKIPSHTLRRFWEMLAYYHGQVFNASEIGRNFGISDHTALKYLDMLSGTFMIRQLRPWHYNTKKRIIKRPKIYFRDSGILHALLYLEKKKNVLSNPRLGASWEGFAIEEVIRSLGLQENEVYFWGVHTGGEIDLVFQRSGNLYGIEIKYSQAPAFTPSMRFAMEELYLKHIWIVYPGDRQYLLKENVTVIPLKDIKEIRDFPPGPETLSNQD